MLVGNKLFGLALQDGTFTSTRDAVYSGEGGGVALIAAYANTLARLIG